MSQFGELSLEEGYKTPEERAPAATAETAAAHLALGRARARLFRFLNSKRIENWGIEKKRARGATRARKLDL